MYRYERDIAFIAHPKTGSQSAAKMMRDNGWRKANNHHELDFPMPLNVISVIRETEDWFVSWYFHNHPKEGNRPEFGKWLQGYTDHNDWARRGFYGLRYTTHLLFFDRLQDGLSAVYQDLGIVGPRELPHLNHKGRNKQPASDFFDEESRKLLDPQMILTYNSLRSQLGDKPYLRIHQ